MRMTTSGIRARKFPALISATSLIPSLLLFLDLFGFIWRYREYVYLGEKTKVTDTDRSVYFISFPS